MNFAIYVYIFNYNNINLFILLEYKLFIFNKRDILGLVLFNIFFQNQ